MSAHVRDDYRLADPYPDEYQLSAAAVQTIRVLTQARAILTETMAKLRALDEPLCDASWVDTGADIAARMDDEVRCCDDTIARLEDGDE